MPRLNDLLESRSTAIAELRSISETAESAGRDLSETESARFAELRSTVTGLDERITRQRQLDDMERSAPASPAINGSIGDGRFEERAHRDFSVVRAIRGALPRDVGGGGVDDGLERELGQELQRRTGRAFTGLPIPDQALVPFEQRVLLAGSSAADLVPTQHLGDRLIERLRPATVCERLGATVLDGLTGDVDVPRQTGSSSAQFVAEDAPLSADDATFDDVQLRIKTCGALTSYSRVTLLNASPSIENLLRADLSKVLGNAVDREALFGDGTSNKPTGIRYSGISYHELEALSTGSPTWRDICAIVATPEGDDVPGDGFAWVMSPWSRKLLRSTLKESGDAAGGYLMDSNKTLSDAPVAVTTAAPGSPGVEGTILYGRFQDLLIGKWSGTDLLVNPYSDTYYPRGRIGLRALISIDTAVRHPESFVYTDNLVVS